MKKPTTPGADTSTIDCFRQGVEVTEGHERCTIAPILGTGRSDHHLVDVDFGAAELLTSPGSFTDDVAELTIWDIIADMRAGRPVTYADPSTRFDVADRHGAYVVIEDDRDNIDVRSRVDTSYAHGTFGAGNVHYTHGVFATDVVMQAFTLDERSRVVFDDSGRSGAGSVSIDVGGVTIDTSTVRSYVTLDDTAKLTPFDDFYYTPTLTKELAAAPHRSNVVSVLITMHPDTDTDVVSDEVAAASGHTWYHTGGVRESIAFGGMTRGS